MKKQIYYATMSLICTIFLVLRFIFAMYVRAINLVTMESTDMWVNMFTIIIVITLLVFIYLGFKESNK